MTQEEIMMYDWRKNPNLTQSLVLYARLKVRVRCLYASTEPVIWPRRSYAKQTQRHAKQIFFILEPCKLYANLKKLHSVAKWKWSPERFATRCRLCRRAAVFGVLRSALVPSV